jgi:hypothetical protein
VEFVLEVLIDCLGVLAARVEKGRVQEEGLGLER